MNKFKSGDLVRLKSDSSCFFNKGDFAIVIRPQRSDVMLFSMVVKLLKPKSKNVIGVRCDEVERFFNVKENK